MSSPGPIDERRLVEAAKQGSESAVETLRSRHRKEVRGYIRARVHPDQVDDIEQDIWIRVHAKLHLYDSNRGPFVAFVKDHAHWRIIEHYREQGCQPNQVTSIDDSESSNILTVMKASSPSPFTVVVELEETERFLRVTFSSSLPPHQLVVFGFVKLLEWKPREVVAELSDQSLRELENRLESDYLQIMCMREAIVRSCFRPLRERMDLRLEQAITDFNTRRPYKHLLDLVAGDRILRDYYTDQNPENNVAHWSFDVRKRILPKLLQDKP